MNVEAYSDRLEQVASSAGFSLSHYGEVAGILLPVLERLHSENAPDIYISAGVHGDEPAPPMAILEMLSSRAFPAKANITVFPMINPTGLGAGTRENASGIDLNRDYGKDPQSVETSSQLKWIGDRTFDLSLCLHEDYDGDGFYVYAHNRDPNGPDYGDIAIQAARPITGIDTRSEIDEMPAKDGRMLPPDDVMDINRNDLPEALRLTFHHATRVSITTETPSCQPITQRITAQCAVVKAVMSTYLANGSA